VTTKLLGLWAMGDGRCAVGRWAVGRWGGGRWAVGTGRWAVGRWGGGVVGGGQWGDRGCPRAYPGARPRPHAVDGLRGGLKGRLVVF